jgi:hypothetical protein
MAFNHRRAVLLAMVCLGAAATALGQGEAAFYLGAAHTQPSAISVDQPSTSTHATFANVAFIGRSFNAPLYYGARAGKFFGAFGFEGEFIHLKVVAQDGQTVSASGVAGGSPLPPSVPLGYVVQHLAISHGVNLALMNFAYRQALPPAGRPHTHVYGTLRAGVGMTVPNTVSTVMAQTHSGYQAGRAAFQLATGLEAPLGRHFGLFGEYKFTRTHQHNHIAGGFADLVLRSHHIVFGTRFSY